LTEGKDGGEKKSSNLSERRKRLKREMARLGTEGGRGNPCKKGSGTGPRSGGTRGQRSSRLIRVSAEKLGRDSKEDRH